MKTPRLAHFVMGKPPWGATQLLGRVRGDLRGPRWSPRVLAWRIARKRKHHHGVDHLDRAVGPVRPPAAGLQAGQRHRREGGRARHRAGARHGPARRRRRAVRARHRRPRRSSSPKASRAQAPAGHVQRLRADRPEGRPGRRQGQGHRRRARRRSRDASAPFVSRGDKSGTARRRAALLEGGGRRHRGRDKPAGLQGVRLRHGPGAQHRGVEQAPTCWPIAAPG